ncbi:hypothetical protein [Streptomyces sp. NPDC001774]
MPAWAIVKPAKTPIAKSGTKSLPPAAERSWRAPDGPRPWLYAVLTLLERGAGLV